jgi:hypothetical protein
MMLRTKMGGVDLNLIGRYSEFFRGAAREHRQNAFRPTDGISAVEHLRADCCALRRRCSGPNAALRRAISRAMAFAQLTYRESLRDIEVCLSAQASKLYHMGFREPVRRSTLADANELRDWRIYAQFAHRLIARPVPPQKFLKQCLLSGGRELRGRAEGLDSDSKVIFQVLDLML